MKNKGEAIMFIPHTSMSQVDYYDLFNFRSDSCLTFARYILDNNLLQDKEIIVFTPSESFISESTIKVKQMYPDRNITFISWDIFLLDYSKKGCIRKSKQFCECILRCSHIFTSITHRLSKFINDQIAVDLNYYSAPFKNDILPRTNKYYMAYDKIGQEYDKIVTTSEVSSRMVMAFMRSMEKHQFSDWGLCRNDNLQINQHHENVKNQILSSLSYKAERIVLYTPTHRDYEEDVKDISRELFGYSIDLDSFDKFLKSEGIVIVAKIHPKQNSEIISKKLPESIIIHTSRHDYGLCELMVVSDCLITDYTSGYFDYLLLDKPVIFNFYDIERYQKERGFTFDPIETITAGEIVKTTEEFIEAIKNISKNRDSYRAGRQFVRNLLFHYQDFNSCQRVYNYYFSDNNK